jgi:hypothetical protein
MEFRSRVERQYRKPYVVLLVRPFATTYGTAARFHFPEPAFRDIGTTVNLFGGGVTPTRRTCFRLPSCNTVVL